jgi:activating signal cointegrator complex subunit 3
MIRFDERNGYMSSTDIGRTASHYYLNAASIELYNDEFRDTMTEERVLQLLSRFTEFENIQVRQEELPELDKLLKACVLPVRGGVENSHGKTNILLQSYISRQYVDAFSLVSDQAYVAQACGMARQASPSPLWRITDMLPCCPERRPRVTRAV